MKDFLKILALCYRFGSKRVLFFIKDGKVDLFTCAYKSAEFRRIVEERRQKSGDFFLLYIEVNDYDYVLEKRGEDVAENYLYTFVQTVTDVSGGIVGRLKKDTFALFVESEDESNVMGIARVLTKQDCRISVVRMSSWMSLSDALSASEYNLYRRKIIKAA